MNIKLFVSVVQMITFFLSSFNFYVLKKNYNIWDNAHKPGRIVCNIFYYIKYKFQS